MIHRPPIGASNCWNTAPPKTYFHLWRSKMSPTKILLADVSRLGFVGLGLWIPRRDVSIFVLFAKMGSYIKSRWPLSDHYQITVRSLSDHYHHIHQSTIIIFIQNHWFIIPLSSNHFFPPVLLRWNPKFCEVPWAGSEDSRCLRRAGGSRSLRSQAMMLGEWLLIVW